MEFLIAVTALLLLTLLLTVCVGLLILSGFGAVALIANVTGNADTAYCPGLLSSLILTLGPLWIVSVLTTTVLL